jgi:hypothetical protein
MQNEKNQMRQYFIDTWHKREQKECLTPLEKQLIDIIQQHPEYHKVLENPKSLDQDYTTDNNPFLHMSMHLGLIEQLTTNRPAGIRELYQQVYNKYGNEHQIQHLIMEIMGEVIWDAQQNQQLPDESLYLKKLRNLA